MKIRVFTTGGSIDKIYSTLTSNFEVGEPQVDQILKAAGVNFAYEVESLFQKDSLEIDAHDRTTVVNRVCKADERLILITHGTDTMAETGKALANIPGKVIVLTGAMQPAAFKTSDAAFNIGAAVIALQTLPEGVYLVMNGQIFDPDQVRKNQALNRFETGEP